MKCFLVLRKPLSVRLCVIVVWVLFSVVQFPGGEGGGGLPYIYICAAASGRVFAQFWSENAYRLYPFWSGIGYGFRWNYESV